MAILDVVRERTTKINDQLFAEEIKLSFLVNGVVDKTRAQMIVKGILTINDELTKKADGGISGTWHVPIAAAPARLVIDRKAYPNIVIRHGDKVQAVSREGEPWFQVTSVKDRSKQRLYVYLSEL